MRQNSLDAVSAVAEPEIPPKKKRLKCLPLQVHRASIPQTHQQVKLICQRYLPCEKSSRENKKRNGQKSKSIESDYHGVSEKSGERPRERSVKAAEAIREKELGEPKIIRRKKEASKRIIAVVFIS